MDITTLLTPEALTTAAAIWVINAILKRMNLFASWHWRKAFYPALSLALALTAALTGFLPAETWQESLTMGVIVAGAVILVYDTGKGVHHAVTNRKKTNLADQIQ